MALQILQKWMTVQLIADVNHVFVYIYLQKEQCFSVVVGAKHKTLDLIADSAESGQAWAMGLKHLKQK